MKQCDCNNAEVEVIVGSDGSVQTVRTCNDCGRQLVVDFSDAKPEHKEVKRERR